MFYAHHPVRVTIDSGATGNFICHTVIRRLGCKVKPSSQSVRICICPSQQVELEIFCVKGKGRCAVKGVEVDCKLDQRGRNQFPKDNHSFCNTMNEIAVVFYPEFSTVHDNCILGIYHSNSWQSTNDRVLAQFKTNDVKRVLIATTALCMGVNFPYVRCVVNWGPARSILDQHQEAGRAGRDGKKSHVIILFHGQQVGHYELEVKDFVRAEGCYRVAAYKSLDGTIASSRLLLIVFNHLQVWRCAM